MSFSGTALIRKDEDSKYVVEASVKGNFDAVWNYKVCPDVVVPQFSGTGLKITFNGYENLTGDQRFSGLIGRNQIKIETTRGVIIEGPIIGGPGSVQTFIGVGTWTSA